VQEPSPGRVGERLADELIRAVHIGPNLSAGRSGVRGDELDRVDQVTVVRRTPAGAAYRGGETDDGSRVFGCEVEAERVLAVAGGAGALNVGRLRVNFPAGVPTALRRFRVRSIAASARARGRRRGFGRVVLT
jgi:hypothetical protein